MRITPILTLISLTLATVLSAAELAWDHTELRVKMNPGDAETQVTFTATNKGDTPVRIERVNTSCGCTGSILKNKLIEPGESAQVIATFTKGKRSGTNRNKLEVYVEGENEPVASLTMIVEIPTLVEASPKIVYWNQQSSQTPRSVTIRFDETYIYKIDEISFDKALMDIEQNADPLKPNELELTVTPKAYDQALRSMITIHGSGPNELKAEAKIHVFVQP